MQTSRIIALAGIVAPVFLCYGQVTRLTVPSEGKVGFTRLEANETKISFENQLDDERGAANRNLLSGSGVAAGDVDADGRIDLFFCGLDSANALYRNLGNWRFEEITARTPAIALPEVDCTGAAFGDVDGDSDVDLLVNALGGGTRLFLNDGSGRFTLKENSGLQTNTGSTSMALADIDGDGDLDLYVANFRTTTIRDDPATRFVVAYHENRPVVQKVNGRPATAPDLTNRFKVTFSGKVIEQGELDALYENDGTGRFSVVSFSSDRFRESDGSLLRELPYDYGLAVQMRDFTGDGAPDIYVCNDYWTPDRTWINDGSGRFRALPQHSLRCTSSSSMGVDFSDVNRDGFFDFIVVDMLARKHPDRHAQVAEAPHFGSTPGEIDSRFQIPRNTLQLNRGDGTFCEISQLSGVEASEWSWNPIFTDVDLDGWEDLLISNGHRRDFQNADSTSVIQEALAAKRLDYGKRRELLDMFPPQIAATAAFRNNGDLSFSDVSTEWGFTSAGIAHGSCLADLDNDGDLDLVMNHLGSTCGVYRNDATGPRIAIRLKGSGKNTAGIGAKITVRSGTLAQSQEMILGGRYLSSDSSQRVFALPGRDSADLEIRWRDGKKTEILGIKPNYRYVVDQTTRSLAE